VMTRARQISLQRPITTALAVFATEADARLATVTYARQTRRPSPDTWPVSCDAFLSFSNRFLFYQTVYRITRCQHNQSVNAVSRITDDESAEESDAN
jgi:hypothetical protein